MNQKCGHCSEVLTEEEIRKDRWITTSSVGKVLVCDYCNAQWRDKSVSEILGWTEEN